MPAVRLACVTILFAGAVALVGCGKQPERDNKDNPNSAPPVGTVGRDVADADTFPPPDPALMALATARSRLADIAIAIDDYRMVAFQYPAGIVGPGGELGLSWRVQVLPYLGEEALYKEFKLAEPWDSEHNKKLIPRMPKVFESPGKPSPPGKTHIRTSTGLNGFIPAPAPPAKGAKPQTRFPNAKAGTVAPGLNPNRIADGTCNTVVALEVAEPVEWTKPEDLTLHYPSGEHADPSIVPKLGGPFLEGFHVVMACGTVYLLPLTTSESDTRALLTPAASDRASDNLYAALGAQKPLQAVPNRVPAHFPSAAAKRAAVKNYQSIAAAVTTFANETRGGYPAEIAGPNKAAGLSWRVQVLPYLGEEALYKEFKLSEPWDSAHNKNLIEKMPNVFASPGKPAPPGHTFLRSTVGPGGLIPEYAERTSGSLKPTAGESLRAGFPDGNIVLFAEAAESVPWTKPDEMPLDSIDLRGGWGRARLPHLGGRVRRWDPRRDD